ncbi:MAG: hypothetical protein JO291_08455 [Acidimicrobiia bacterium]|nr:hypothetical protein [Acidimicrobiia bacterium]
MRAGARLALGLGWWVLALVVLVRVGQRSLSTPPLTDLSRFRAWLDARDGVEAAFALLRLGAIAACGYLVSASVVGLVAQVTSSARLAHLSELMTTPAVRRLVGGVAGLGLSASVVSFAVSSFSSNGDRLAVSSAAEPAPDGIVLERLPADDPVVIERVDDGDAHRGTATMRVVPVADPVPPAAPAPPAAAAPATATWTVQPGESLWGKASSVLSEAWGRAPTDREVAPYWRSLVDVNRSRLADPANPDLIFSQQVLEVPPPPG